MWQMPSVQSPNIVGAYMGGLEAGRKRQSDLRTQALQERRMSLWERQEERASEDDKKKLQKDTMELMLGVVEFSSKAETPQERKEAFDIMSSIIKQSRPDIDFSKLREGINFESGEVEIDIGDNEFKLPRADMPEYKKGMSDLLKKHEDINSPAFKKEANKLLLDLGGTSTKIGEGKKDKPTYDMQTIYGPKGQTKRVSVKKGTDYVPPEGWSLEKPAKEETPRTDLLPSEKESLIQHHIRSFGAPRNNMGQIMNLDPENKKERLAGWLRTRDIESKSDRLLPDELDRIEQAVMTEVGLDFQTQSAIKASRMAGATSNELLELLGMLQPESETVKLPIPKK